MVNVGEMLTGVNARNGSWIDEVIAHAVADADDEKQHGGDAGEDYRALA